MSRVSTWCAFRLPVRSYIHAPSFISVTVVAATDYFLTFSDNRFLLFCFSPLSKKGEFLNRTCNFLAIRCQGILTFRYTCALRQLKISTSFHAYLCEHASMWLPVDIEVNFTFFFSRIWGKKVFSFQTNVLFRSPRVSKCDRESTGNLTWMLVVLTQTGSKAGELIAS